MTRGDRPSKQMLKRGKQFALVNCVIFDVFFGSDPDGSRPVQVRSEKDRRVPCGVPGGPRASRSGPLGAFLGVLDLQEEVTA